MGYTVLFQAQDKTNPYVVQPGSTDRAYMLYAVIYGYVYVSNNIFSVSTTDTQTI